MKIIEPSFTIEDDIRAEEILKKIEKAGRVCYKSEDLMTGESAGNFIKRIIAQGHESVLEHEKITVKIVCDRGVTHEIIRHRIASYSQESTRYCNYSKDRFGNEITVIKPFFWNEGEEKYEVWKKTMREIEKAYIKLMEAGAEPQQARSILPNSLKTEIVVTMNLREWRHFLKLRTSGKSHPQMQQIARMILNEFKQLVPIVFDDIN